MLEPCSPIRAKKIHYLLDFPMLEATSRGHVSNKMLISFETVIQVHHNDPYNYLYAPI